MSIQTELTRLTNAKAAIKTAIEGKGITVPSGTLLDGMAALIESIEAGGGSGNFVTGTFTTTDDITSNVVINHNLGVKPKFIIVLCTDASTYTGAKEHLLAFYYLYQYNSNRYYGQKYQSPNSSTVSYNSGSVKSSGSADTGAWYKVNVDETTFTLKQARIHSTYGIGASKSFFWIAYGE